MDICQIYGMKIVENTQMEFLTIVRYYIYYIEQLCIFTLQWEYK